MKDLLSTLTDKSALLEALKAIDDDGDKWRIDEEEMRDALKERVRGQNQVIDDFVRLVRLQWVKNKRKRPVANAIFLGPTGTGKTELSKAAAEYLFGDENDMLRFDCSEFKSKESLNRLVGVPTGIVGADRGGELTRALLGNPRRLILFDEIEKAHPAMYDLFLQMMGDGRLTEQGTGKTADLTQSVIILTSNAEQEAISSLKAGIEDPHELMNAIKSHLADAKVLRPEILGRIDRVYVFKRLPTEVMAEIALLKLGALAQSYGLALAYVRAELIIDALRKNRKISQFGIRELERILDQDYGPAMAEAREAGASCIRLEIDGAGGVEIRPGKEAPAAK